MLAWLLHLIKTIISFVPCLVYEFVYSKFYTEVTYRHIGQRINASGKKINALLDVGTATGHPLYSIVNNFPKETRILGIDIDTNYIGTCQKLFQPYQNVTIRHMDFYNIENEIAESFDVIIFGSSFMLMPNQQKALEIAKRKLSNGGKLYFLLTLYNRKSIVTQILDLVKPYLKYLTTVDFGKMTYDDQFEQILTSNKLRVTYKQRVQTDYNILLKMFRFFVFEAEAISIATAAC